MRFEDKKLKAQRRRASWVVGLICGPVFAVIFCLAWFIPPLLANFNLPFWLPLIGSVAATAPLADRIGKRHKVMPEQFAGPVALCCILFGGLLMFITYGLITASQY